MLDLTVPSAMIITLAIASLPGTSSLLVSRHKGLTILNYLHFITVLTIAFIVPLTPVCWSAVDSLSNVARHVSQGILVSSLELCYMLFRCFLKIKFLDTHVALEVQQWCRQQRQWSGLVALGYMGGPHLQPWA